MKRYIKYSVAVLLVVFLIVGSIIPVFSATQPTTYSKNYNSGKRGVICTSLDGTSAAAYYTGNYTYDNLSSLSSSSLYSSLQTLMRSTHTYISSYDDCHYKADRADCENGNGKISLIYTSYEATMSQWNGWNREHVWPKSLGGNSTTGGGADMHHIRPADATVNSTRSNKKYGYANTGKEVYGTNPAVGFLGGYSSTYFEPLDNVKGDVARICLYVYVRWGSDWGATSITKVFQSVDVLLEWCELDPVDTWEMGRNEVVQDIQGNRNVFIDYPELAWTLFDKEPPNDMVTPSGEASGGNSNLPTTDPTEKPTETPTEKPVIPTPTTPNGTLEEPLTVSQILIANSELALDDVSNNVFYVKGKVVAIGSTGSYYKNVYITDGTEDFLIYSINMGSGISGFDVGDTIVARGYVKNYYGTIEMATKYINNSPNYVICVKVLDDEVATEPPTETPTEKPTEAPTEPPTQKPTEAPTEPPTEKPTEAPTEPPTEKPTEAPTEPPTEKPTEAPTEPPTETPTEAPTEPPTEKPTESPTEPPTEKPTEAPTEPPTEKPTETPTEPPTEKPTEAPTQPPTQKPTEAPTEPPTEKPTEAPNEQSTLDTHQINVSFGCGSTVSVSLVGLVTAIAAGLVLYKKKK